MTKIISSSYKYQPSGINNYYSNEISKLEKRGCIIKNVQVIYATGEKYPYKLIIVYDDEKED